MKKIIYSLLISIISLNITLAQDDKESKKDDAKKEKSFEEVTKQSKLIEGLFDIYQDSISGKIQMLIKEEQLNKDFIYGSQIADGIVQAGGFRGLYNDEKIINFKKFFDKIEISFKNTNFYFDENNPLYKSREANISNAIISSSKIDFHDKKNGTYLINANDLFLSESLTRVKPPSRPNQSRTAFSLGSLDKAKSTMLVIIYLLRLFDYLQQNLDRAQLIQDFLVYQLSKGPIQNLQELLRC